VTSSVATPANSNLEQLAEKADKALAEVHALPSETQTKALALKNAIEELHKLGLTRIVQRLKEDAHGKELLFALVDDPAVYALFVMHGLVREDLRTRVERVLETVRPYMQSHGGDVELTDVTPDTVFVRLSGSCNGCSMSAVTLRNTVEEALREHLPQIQSVEVVPNEPEPSGFVPLDALSAPPRVDPGWAIGPSASSVIEAEPFRWDIEGTSILIVRFHDRLQAFRNECAHLGMPLDGGRINPETGVLTCPWHGFRYDCTNGECLTVPEAQLEALPLRVEKGRVIVRIAS
jgi:Fe-S cluster biogenesis protein NfuA/nitrite reductase/ring-hydroxylating ferredoxin subunit